MQNDVYDYTSQGSVAKNTVLQKTYRLLGLSFIPAVAGAFFSAKTGFNIFAMFGSYYVALAAFFGFFYGMTFLIEKNRYSNVGVALLMIFTFGMGLAISPMLQYALAINNGAQIVGTAAAMTAATLDLPLNQSLGFAYIVPFRNGKTGHQEAQFQIGYKGFIQLAMRSGQMKRIVAEPIYEAQIISRNPIKGYEFDFDRQPEKHEAPAGYYAYMELINGFTAEAYMTVAQIQEHAARYSQTAKKGYGVWKDNFDAMALKTVLKKLLTKYAPMSVEMQQAVISDQAVIHDIPPEGDIINHSEVFDYADNHENGGQPAETAPDEAERADAQGIPEAEFAKLCEAVSTGETDFETAAKTPNLSQVQRDTLESL